VAIWLLILIVVLLGAYIFYISENSKRIADNKELDINYLPSTQDALTSDKESSDDPATDMSEIQTGKPYSLSSYNVGFGAYDHDFSFFMDTNKLKDGTDTKGISSRAKDMDAVLENTNECLQVILEQDPDLMMFQEVDKSADRSFQVNQYSIFCKGWTQKEVPAVNTFAVNMHTGYLMYPLTKPIGRVKESGLLTISKFKMNEAKRIQLPVTDKFPDKFFDLDRCMSVMRLPVKSKSESDTGRELILINIHASAYDEGGLIRAEQMKLLMDIISSEYENDNWVIVGGDFNHAMFGSEEMYRSQMQIPPWVQPFDESVIPEGFTLIKSRNIELVATCRDTSMPYIQGVNYEVTIDGFIVSDNIRATVTNIDADYKGSDHNPVLLDFMLKE